MYKRFFYFFIMIIMIGVNTNFSAHIINASEVSTRKIIIFNNNISKTETKNSIIKKYGIIKNKDLLLINGMSVNLTGSQEKKLRNEKDIIRIEDDVNVEAIGKSKTISNPTPIQPGQIVPWNVSRIKADMFSGSNLGQSIKVAIIDSGIDLTHPDLKDSIKGGYNAISRKSSYNDDYGHGTHVAGIIAAQNNSIGVIGVSPNVSLYAVKVLGSIGTGYVSDLIEGIQWAITNNMQIINMSLGVSDSLSLHDAIIKANNAGIILVAAAGNNPYESVKYPAAYSEVISVVATDYNNQISNICPNGKIDISAPGSDIFSTYKNSGYMYMTGTSMAAPHVTGAVALLLSTPSKCDSNNDGNITLQEVKQRLQETAIDLGSPGIDTTYGAGLLDVYKIIN